MEWPLPRVTEEEAARLRRIPDEFRQCFLDLFGAPAEITGNIYFVVLLQPMVLEFLEQARRKRATPEWPDWVRLVQDVNGFVDEWFMTAIVMLGTPVTRSFLEPDWLAHRFVEWNREQMAERIDENVQQQTRRLWNFVMQSSSPSLFPEAVFNIMTEKPNGRQLQLWLNEYTACGVYFSEAIFVRKILPMILSNCQKPSFASRLVSWLSSDQVQSGLEKKRVIRSHLYTQTESFSLERIAPSLARHGQREHFAQFAQSIQETMLRGYIGYYEIRRKISVGDRVFDGIDLLKRVTARCLRLFPDDMDRLNTVWNITAINTISCTLFLLLLEITSDEFLPNIIAQLSRILDEQRHFIFDLFLFELQNMAPGLIKILYTSAPINELQWSEEAVRILERARQRQDLSDRRTGNVRAPLLRQQADDTMRVRNIQFRLVPQAEAVEQVAPSMVLEQNQGGSGWVLVECPICFDNISNPIECLRCMHLFHTSCLNEWLTSQDINSLREGQTQCPLCRQPIVATNLTTIEALVDWSLRRGRVRARETDAVGEDMRATVPTRRMRK